MKRLSIVLGASLAIALPATPAAAQPAGDAVEAGISSASLDAGERATVFGRGWRGGTEVRILLAGREVGVTTVGDEGRFSRSVPVPEDLEPGAVQVVVEGTDASGEPASYSIPVTITGDGTPRGSWISVATVAVIVAGILLVAGLLLLWRRRRASIADLERAGVEPVPDPDPRKRESAERGRGDRSS